MEGVGKWGCPSSHYCLGQRDDPGCRRRREMMLDGIGSAPTDRAIAALFQPLMTPCGRRVRVDRDALRGRQRQDAVGAAIFCAW